MPYLRINDGLRLTIIGLIVLVVSGCAYQGGDVGLFERKLTWYSYLNGDDLRNRCEKGQGDTLRLVYNAIHTEQIRTYDITIPPQQTGELQQANAAIRTRILGPAYLTRISLDDMLAPWRGDKATTYLRPEDIDRLWRAMETSLVFDPAPEGLFLKSEQFFWLIATCRDGVFHYNAYVWPSDRFDHIQFDALLFAWDMTEIPVNPPRKATLFDIYDESSPRHKTGGYYQVSIGKNGLK